MKKVLAVLTLLMLTTVFAGEATASIPGYNLTAPPVNTSR